MPESEETPSPPPLQAGAFSAWLKNARLAIIHDTSTDVECGDCVGCCSSSYFIHIQPEESATLKCIDKDFLAPALGLPKGHLVMAYDQDGICPMLKSKACSIYAQRPKTCRNYDCRIFAAAGILAGENDKSSINERIKRWRFSYPNPIDLQEHSAVQAAAEFIKSHPKSFPNGRIPSAPNQLALLAIKAYPVFLKLSKAKEKSNPKEIAQAIVETCRNFDSQKSHRTMG